MLIFVKLLCEPLLFHLVNLCSWGIDRVSMGLLVDDSKRKPGEVRKTATLLPCINSELSIWL